MCQVKQGAQMISQCHCFHQDEGFISREVMQTDV